jgi:NitT/TauT family transport system ATP-binding protein
MVDMPAIIIQGLYKSFAHNNGKRQRVLDDINLSVEQNEFICILGHSGCGKTTLLRLVCGFEKADSGVVLIDGAKYEKASRNVLMMFQDFNQAFPWKTVLQNVVHPLRIAGNTLSRPEARARAIKRIADVDLQDFVDAYPHQLSGGMKQRVAVARALALQPRVLLMDEPFASLDAITRKSLQDLTMRICDKYGLTVMFVTHSVEEAARMANRIVLMSRSGRIENIFNNPFRQNFEPENRMRLISEIIEFMEKSSQEDQTA